MLVCAELFKYSWCKQLDWLGVVARVTLAVAVPLTSRWHHMLIHSRPRQYSCRLVCVLLARTILLTLKGALRGLTSMRCCFWCLSRYQAVSPAFLILLLPSSSMVAYPVLVQGAGLHTLLTERSDVLRGITNGIDATEWDPTSDKHLPTTYRKETLGVRG
jgi:hypothetical protein